MTEKTTLDDAIELLHPHKRLLRDILSRTDTHQYLQYVKTHYTACVTCPYQQECPPCTYVEPPITLSQIFRVLT